VTAAALGVSAAGIDLIRPAAAHTPIHLTVVAAQWMQAADGSPAELAPAALMPAVPERIRLVFSLLDATPGEPQEAAWQEAVTVPDRPIGASSAAGTLLSLGDLRPTPAPVMKPRVVARAVPDSAVPSVVPKPRTSRVSVTAVIASFASFGYDLDQVRAAAKPVPRLYLEALPHDLANVSSVETKKRLFVQTVLPIILRVNEEITTTRRRVKRLGERLLWDGALTAADREWLIGTAELYGAAPFDVPGLLSRIDIVPPSLALAQAVEETGWGTSRFVREGNALFGQYTYKSVTGMVPERRDADRRHRVRSHDNLLAAVRAYVHNLNSHWAYEDFRDRRAQLRRAGRPIDGYDLAGELGHYSERRAAYVQSIRRVMRQNRLDDFDGAWLNNRKWTALIGLPSEQPI
jgi:Bax protein